jgi:uncharacterized protein (UPF0210 family)
MTDYRLDPKKMEGHACIVGLPMVAVVVTGVIADHRSTAYISNRGCAVRVR